MTTEFLPETTIRYRTFLKNTLVAGLRKVFDNHPDPQLRGAKVSIEYPKTQAEYPSTIVRFYERQIFNAGVGHAELIHLIGTSDSDEIAVTVPETGGAIQLTWPKLAYATGYIVYKGGASNKQDEVFAVSTNSYLDNGAEGLKGAVPNDITSELDPPQVIATVLPPGGVRAGTYYYRVVATAPTQAVKFKHYFYSGDIELAVYALTSLDRDLLADAIVQTITMGTLEPYTNAFYDLVYPTQRLYPDSFWHFVNVNSDQLQGFGETQTQAPWGAEDELIYTTSYRFGVFGELYSLPPKLTYGMVRQVLQFPYIPGVEPVPEGPQPPGIWVPAFDPLV